jgi:hypothetical protein
LGLLQSLASSVDVTAQQKAQLLEALDEAIDLTPFLGAQFKLSELLVDLTDGQLDLAPLIQAASQFLLSADGQVKLGLSLPDELGLTSAGGSRINNIEFGFALESSPSASLPLNSTLSELVSDGLGFYDLDAFLSQLSMAEKEVQGFLVDLPEGILMDWDMATSLSGLQSIDLSVLIEQDLPPVRTSADGLSNLEMTVWAYDSGLVLSQGLSVPIYEL